MDRSRLSVGGWIRRRRNDGRDYPVADYFAGVSVGRVWGRTLVTGIASLSHQERLQFEAINGPIALAVIDVLLKEFPAVAHCRKYLVSPIVES